VNGDGYGDVIVSTFFYDNGQSNEGAAFIFLGSASGVADGNPATAHAQLESNQADAYMGNSVASAGDVNGDGYADVIVGAFHYDSGQTNEGAAFIFLGSATGVADGNPATAHAELESNQADEGLFVEGGMGSSVASAGDVNGDGYADVIVGAEYYEVGPTTTGAAFVFLGSASGVADGNPSSAHAQLVGAQDFDHLGHRVASAGDVNGDGYADVIVGAYGRVKAQLQACPQAVPFGDASCTSAVTPDWIAVNGATPDVAISHTLTGLVGNELYRWRARVLHAPPTGPLPANPPHAPWRRFGAQSVEADIRTGAAADADGDGVPDATDNCPTVANADQQDGNGGLGAPADGVGNACDNCLNANNPRVAAGFLTTNPWATLTGGQRDDDHDGYGNRCDAKFVGLPSANVGGLDLAQFRASNAEDRRFDTCGTANTRPCAIFDLDEAAAGNAIGGLDLGRFRQVNAATPGPRCAACTGTGSVPLPCTAGTAGTCF
jgi:hypothetical protein